MFLVKPVPKVIWEEKTAASAEVFPHQVVQPPKREKKRRAVLRVLCRGLIEPKKSIRNTEWGPYCSFTFFSSREMVSKASSQEMGSNLPLPRSPALFNGTESRSGAYMTSRWASPRAQAFKPGPNRSSVVILWIFPSKTCTFSRQRPPQS